MTKNTRYGKINQNKNRKGKLQMFDVKDMMPLQKKDMMSLRDCSNFLGVSYPTMLKISQKDGFPVIQISPRRKVVYRPFFEEWILQQGASAKAGAK